MKDQQQEVLDLLEAQEYLRAAYDPNIGPGWAIAKAIECLDKLLLTVAYPNHQ